jgi:hypothetical protein
VAIIIGELKKCKRKTKKKNTTIEMENNKLSSYMPKQSRDTMRRRRKRIRMILAITKDNRSNFDSIL